MMNRVCVLIMLLVGYKASAQEIVLVLPEGHDYVTSFAVYNEGKRCVSLESSAKSFIWDIERAQVLATVLDSNALGPVVISADEKIIIAGQSVRRKDTNADTTFLIVFSTDSLKLIHKIRLPFIMNNVFQNLLFSFSVNGDTLSLRTKNDNRKMRIDIKKGKILNSSFDKINWEDELTIKEIQDTVYNDRDKNIFAYNSTDTFNNVPALIVDYKGRKIKLANRLILPVGKLFSPDDQRVYLIYPNYISKFDLSEGRLTPSILPLVSGINKAAISFDEKLMAIKTKDRKIQLWDLPGKFKIFETEAPPDFYDFRFDIKGEMLLLISLFRDPASRQIIYKKTQLDIQQRKLTDTDKKYSNTLKPEFNLVMGGQNAKIEEAKVTFTVAAEVYYDSVSTLYLNKYPISPWNDTATFLIPLNISIDGEVGYMENTSWADINGLSVNQQYEFSTLTKWAFGNQVKYLTAGNDIFSFDYFGKISNNFTADAISNRSKYLFLDNRLFGFASRREVLAIYAIAGAGFLTKTPDNYYMSAGTPNKWLSFRKKNQLISFEQLDVKYNRPDKVLEAIGSTDTALIKSYRKAWEKRIKKLGIDTTSFNDGYSVPEADFTNRDAIAYEQKAGILKLIIKGADSAYQLDRFNVWVNETPVFGQRGISIRKRNKNGFDTTISIKLSQGENRIETSITNTNGTESYRMPLTVNYSPLVKQKETTRFIGIGIDQFADNQYNLQYSSKDIRDLAKKLKEKYGNDIFIDTLFNKNVTISNVKALKQKLQQTTENDKVIIAYSGHGMLNKEYDYYLSTYAVNFEKPEQNGLPYDELENLLDSIPARKKLLLIDACHSGEVDKEELIRLKASSDSLIKGVEPVAYKQEGRIGLKNSFELMQSLFVNVGKSTGATIISAAAGTQFALERNDLKNGVFTFSILEALNKYPTLKISELKKIVGERVEQLTNGLQKPTSRNETIAVDWSF